MSIAQPATSARCRRSGRARCAARRADAAAKDAAIDQLQQQIAVAAAPARVVQAPAVRQQERALRADARSRSRCTWARCSDGLPVPPARSAEPSSTVPAHTRRAPAQRLRRRQRERAVLRRDARCRCSPSRCPTPRPQDLGARAIRGRRREGQPPPGAAPGQLRGAEVRAPGDQAAATRRRCTARRRRWA